MTRLWLWIWETTKTAVAACVHPSGHSGAFSPVEDNALSIFLLSFTFWRLGALESTIAHGTLTQPHGPRACDKGCVVWETLRRQSGPRYMHLRSNIWLHDGTVEAVLKIHTSSRTCLFSRSQRLGLHHRLVKPNTSLPVSCRDGTILLESSACRVWGPGVLSIGYVVYRVYIL